MQKDGFSVKLVNFVGSFILLIFGIYCAGAFSYSFESLGLSTSTFSAKMAYFLLGLWFILVVVMANLFCWHYDKYLKDKILNNPLSKTLVISFVTPCSNNTMLKFKLFRTMTFYFGAVGNFRRYRKNPDMKAVLDGFDFKKHATVFEKFLVWAFTAVMVVMFIFMFISIFQQIF